MRKNKKGFTLAEVLITLTIIGVVAALTIPSLLANVSEKTYESKRKGLETRLAQAVAQMDNLTSYKAKPPEGSTEDPIEYSVKYSSMNFVTEGLSKVFKITNICEFDSFSACDVPTNFSQWDANFKYTTATYRKLSDWNTRSTEANFGGPLTEGVAFKTKNGESILLWYNPYCIAEQPVPEGGSKIWRKEVCAFMLIDLDGGKKGPNILGHDMHAGIIMYPDTPFLKVPHTMWHGNTTANLPSFDATDPTNTAEYSCSVYSRVGFPAGSMRLGTRIEQYCTALLFWNYKLWTSDVEGPGADDYAWLMVPPYVELAPRTSLAGTYCKIKESRM